MNIAPYRLARVRPLDAERTGTVPAPLPEQFFARNDAADFESPEGRVWTLVETPFPTSPANQNSAPREGWVLGATLTQEQFTFLAPCAPVNVFGMAHNTGAPGRALPPQAFHKAASSVVGPGDAIALSPTVGYVDPEAELTVVVGQPARNLTLKTPARPFWASRLATTSPPVTGKKPTSCGSAPRAPTRSPRLARGLLPA